MAQARRVDMFLGTGNGYTRGCALYNEEGIILAVFVEAIVAKILDVWVVERKHMSSCD